MLYSTLREVMIGAVNFNRDELFRCIGFVVDCDEDNPPFQITDLSRAIRARNPADIKEEIARRLNNGTCGIFLVPLARMLDKRNYRDSWDCRHFPLVGLRRAMAFVVKAYRADKAWLKEYKSHNDEDEIMQKSWINDMEDEDDYR